jgi:hypothetical protein
MIERLCVIFFRFFLNFVSSCVWYVHGMSMCTRYAPLKLLSCLVRTPKKGSPSAMVKLILCDHEVMSSSPGKSLVEMQRKSVT